MLCIFIEHCECCYTGIIRDFPLYFELKKDFKNCNIYLIVLKNNSLYTNIKSLWVLGWLFAFSTSVLISLFCNFLLASLTCNISSTKRIVDVIDLSYYFIYVKTKKKIKYYWIYEYESHGRLAYLWFWYSFHGHYILQRSSIFFTFSCYYQCWQNLKKIVLLFYVASFFNYINQRIRKKLTILFVECYKMYNKIK